MSKETLSVVKQVERRRLPITCAIPIADYRSLPVPGIDGARIGTTFVRVTDLPTVLDHYMEINPRVPSRTKSGVLSGPVSKGILETLREQPTEMALKNLGIYLLVDQAKYSRPQPGHSGPTELVITLADKGKHGIVNGGHTYAAIREAVESATSEDELKALQSAFVRLHIYTGVSADHVPEIAEGTNRSKQVDDPSLVNLQGDFDIIRREMRGKLGADTIAYHQGDMGDVYISEVLVQLEMFNRLRFSDSKHPNALYNRQALGLKYFSADMDADPVHMRSLIKLLPDILQLGDRIRKLTPAAANKNALQFGRIKVQNARAKQAKEINLPFIGEATNYRVPNGWVYPMLAAFRANLKDDYTWRVPIDSLLPAIIEDLVRVCVSEHRDNNARPELIGKRESAYINAYSRMELYLAKSKLL